MTFTELLNEEFIDYAKNNFGNKPAMMIFKNPSSKDISTIKKEEKPSSFRFFIDPKGDVYLFNGELLHNNAIKRVFKTKEINHSQFIKGETDVNGKINGRELIYRYDPTNKSNKNADKIIDRTHEVLSKNSFFNVKEIG